MGTSTESLPDPVAGRPGGQMMGRSGNVRGTSVIHVIFKFNSEIYKLTLTGYSTLYSEL